MLTLQLLEQYCETEYHVDAGVRAFVLRVAARHPEFDAWLQRLGVTTWAVATAWNPRSIPLSEEENVRRQAALCEDLRRAGIRFFPAEGRGTGDLWPPEPSVLMLDRASEESLALARVFEQNAIVAGAIGEPAELRFCFPEEAVAALTDALTSHHPAVHWTALRARGPADRSA